MSINKDKLPTEHQIKAQLARVKTINDLFADDEINGILKDLQEMKPDIGSIIVLYIDKRDNRLHWTYNDGILQSTAVWMLESAKMDFLKEGED